MILLLKRVLQRAGIDRAIGYTMISRIVQGLGGALSVFFIAKFLSSDEQGFYFTFNSLLAIQLFFELGLNTIITQFAAHECAKATWSDSIPVFDSARGASRLASLLHMCVRFFGITSLLLFATLVMVGRVFFSTYGASADAVWQAPWIMLSAITGLLLFVNPLLAFLEGLGKVKEVALVRLYQQVVSIVVLFCGLVSGLGLFAAPVAQLLGLVIVIWRIANPQTRGLLQFIWHQLGAYKISFKKEVFPFQWRIAISWMSGYFIFQLFNPVLFASAGPKTAGQMGLTLAALNGVSSICLSWYNTKIPTFSGLIARQEYQLLDNLFQKTVSQASIACAGLLLVFNGLVWALWQVESAFAERFTPPVYLALLSVITLVNQFVYGLATYLRCHKKEPFLIQSVTLGVTSGLATIFFGTRYGIAGITISYFTLTIGLSLTWSVSIFQKKKTHWHA